MTAADPALRPPAARVRAALTAAAAGTEVLDTALLDTRDTRDATTVLPTAGGARHSAGLSVGRFLKPLTYQRVAESATHAVADAVDVISESEGMAAHRATATLRLDRLT